MAFYLLQENGDRLLLEDGSGSLLLEAEGTTYLRPIAPIMAARRRKRRCRVWWLPFLMTLLS